MHVLLSTLTQYFFLCFQELTAGAGQFPIDPQLQMDNLNRLWDRFSVAQQEKDLGIQAEISRYVAFDINIYRLHSK